MSQATEAWCRLSLAMRDTAPECLGLELFTADDLTQADVDVCAAICKTCPAVVSEPCAQYAEITRPKTGVWAGKLYRKPTRDKASPTGLMSTQQTPHLERTEDPK